MEDLLKKNRTQFVEYNGHCFEYRQIMRVPQESILGPLHFLIYINDICNVSKISEFILFADDTNIFFFSWKHWSTCPYVKFGSWENISLAQGEKLSLNVMRTKFMLFKPRHACRRDSDLLSLYINSQVICQVENTAFLCVTIDESLSWKPHMSCVANKIPKSIGKISQARF